MDIIHDMKNPEQQVRKAIVDLGSLKVKVAIFDTQTKKLLKTSSYLTLLGKSIEETGLIHSDSIRELDVALAETTRDLRSANVEDIMLIGTEALRRAENITEVYSLIEKHLPGHTLNVIDQHREATLFFKAVSQDFPNQDIAAIDIGGGSVQLTYGRYDTTQRKTLTTKHYHFKTGTYTLSQRYSPDSNQISQSFDIARGVVKKAFGKVNDQAPALIFGSTCMLDFIRSTGIATQKEDGNDLHPVHVEHKTLVGLLDELRTIEPSKRNHYFPGGGYFMYGADYLLLNLLEAIERVRPQKIYPTNLNSSYGLL